MPRRLRVGIQLPEAERLVRWSEYASLAAAAEEVGFDSIWVGDHLLYRDEGDEERGPWDAWSLLAGLATVTSRVRLGPLVACMAFHLPGSLARMAATVDEISNGRLVLGLGAGWNEPEFRAFGLPFDDRVARFEEAFAVVRTLLDGERVTFRGRYWHMEDAVLLPRPARRPPLMVGSTGERVLTATLPHADRWNVWGPWYGNDPAGFAAESARVDVIAGRVGRNPRSIERSVCVFTRLNLDAGEEPIDEGAPPLEGSPARMARGLRAFAEAGAQEAILVVSPTTGRSIRALGEVLALLDDSSR